MGQPVSHVTYRDADCLNLDFKGFGLTSYLTPEPFKHSENFEHMDYQICGFNLLHFVKILYIILS